MTETNYDDYSEFKENVQKSHATYQIKDIVPGYYSAKANFDGSVIFAPAIWPPETPQDYQEGGRGEKFYGLFDLRYYAEWNVNDVSLVAFTSTNITAILQDVDGNPIVNQNIKYKFSQQKEVEAVTDHQGKITVPYVAKCGGTIQLQFTYEGTKKYAPCEKTINITINKVTPTITVNNLSVYIGNTCTITATLSQDGIPIPNKTLIINVQGNSYTLKTNSLGQVTTPSFNNPNVGTFTINASYTPNNTTVGGVKDSDNYNSTTKTGTLTVLPKEACSITITKIDRATYGTSINIEITLKDKSGAAISNVKPTLKVNNKTITVPNNTDTNGKTIIPYTVNTTGTLDIYSSFSSQKYSLVSTSIQVAIGGIPTTLSEYTNRKESDGNDLLVKLIDTNSGQELSNMTIKFFEGTTLLDTVTTNGNGIARCNGAFLSIGNHNIKAQFEGTNVYSASETSFTFTAEFLIDTCNDLRSWSTILENWYASDGTSTFGLDVNNINKGETQKERCRKYEGLTTPSTYKRNCSRVNDIPKSSGGYQHLFLRNYCNDLKNQATQDNNGLHAPTGVILRSKYLKTTENCTIQFKLKFAYNGINEKTTGKAAVPREFGGHFGLMREDATTAEFAPVRLEVYRRNSYCIVDGGNLTSNRYAYNFMENVEYTVQIHVTSNKTEINVLELNGTTSFTNSSSNFVGLYPYIFAFTNGTELIIREMKIIPR